MNNTAHTPLKNGQPVKITYGMGRSVLGQISDFVTSKWGNSYEITTEDGEVEYFSPLAFVTGKESGVKLL